jgi:hypothetical protein
MWPIGRARAQHCTYIRKPCGPSTEHRSRHRNAAQHNKHQTIALTITQNTRRITSVTHESKIRTRHNLPLWFPSAFVRRLLRSDAGVAAQGCWRWWRGYPVCAPHPFACRCPSFHPKPPSGLVGDSDLCSGSGVVVLDSGGASGCDVDASYPRRLSWRRSCCLARMRCSVALSNSVWSPSSMRPTVTWIGCSSPGSTCVPTPLWR